MFTYVYTIKKMALGNQAESFDDEIVYISLKSAAPEYRTLVRPM